MFIGQHSVEIVKGAAGLTRLCENCKNSTEHVLVDQPTGLGFGLPFAKRPLWSSHRLYGLVCPTCSWLTEITKDEAQALIRKGQAST